MIEIITFVAEFFSSDHLVIGTNVALAVVSYRLIPSEQRHVIRHAVVTVVTVAKVRKAAPAKDETLTVADEASYMNM